MPGAEEGMQRWMHHPPLPAVDQEPRGPGQCHSLPRNVLRPRRPPQPHRRRPATPPPRHFPVSAA
ncbi:hypothetical protein B296_00029559 [Ensete ventricosum]|uniref:Uncharacterized protein n=1 Tax=Ensete ventricosum TaxID=4639 RepID=A0A426XCX0_ENSVE|nr:hypothetical protein B296_00029559 [Ensete ventricosum]